MTPDDSLTRRPGLRVTVNGADYSPIGGASIDVDDGESTGSARVDIIDLDRTIRQWDEVAIYLGYDGVLTRRFTGRVVQISRRIGSAIEGGEVSLACAGITIDALDITTTTPLYNTAYLGFGDWHSGAWTRSEIIEDLCRIHSIEPRMIEATVRTVSQKPFVQMKLADIFAELAIPEYGKFRFDAAGVFTFFTVRTGGEPDYSIAEGNTLLSVEVEEQYDKVANQILVVGSATDPVTAIKPQADVGTVSYSIAPQNVSDRIVPIKQCVVDSQLIHVAAITAPTGYTPTHIPNWTASVSNPTGGTTFEFAFTPVGQQSGQLPLVKNFRVVSLSGFYDSRPDIQTRGYFLVLYEGDVSWTTIASHGFGTGTVLSVTDWTATRNVQRAQAYFPDTVGGRISISSDYWYEQVPESGKTVNVTRQDEKFPVPVPPATYALTSNYYCSIASTYQFDTVTLALTIRGRQAATASYPIIYYSVRDDESVDDFNERNIEIRSGSINTEAEAQAIGNAVLAACKELVLTYKVVAAGHIGIEPSKIVRVVTLNVYPQRFIGALVDLYIVSVSHAYDISPEGDQWTTSFTAIPVARSILSVVRNFGMNPIKDRASAQAEFLSSYLTGQVSAIESSTPLVPGEADKNRYGVRILSAGLPEVHDVGNSCSEQFAVGDTVIMIFQDGDRSRPHIIGRSPQIIAENITVL